MNTCLSRSIRALALVAVALLIALPAAAQYNYFPGGAATNDGRTVVLAGDSIQTLAQDSLTFILAVPPGVASFELGIFDGETGMTNAGLKHWDNGTTQLQYALFYDPYQQGSTDPANLVGVWRGNEVNPTVDPGGEWTASSATFPDNDWWNLNVNVPIPPEPLPGQAPSGATFYHLCVSYRAASSSTALGPCTGDVRPVDASPSTISNFKIRATANISVLSFAFAYEAALRVGGNSDLRTIYPSWDGTIPPVGSTFWLTTPTTYDGIWSFNLDVPTSQSVLRLFGGDFDFGTNPSIATTFPSQQPIVPCVDTDDPDTPNDASYPPFAVMGGMRIDDSLPEGARLTGGSPSDNSSADIFRREPCVVWTLTSPGADRDISTAADNVVYSNDNPSSQREWEQFLVDTIASCDNSLTCDPSISNCADYCESGLLPSGTWRVDIQGVDLSNLNAWRSENVSGFCINCGVLPRPYLVGDTVFEDLDGNGVQDAGEPGISGIVVELLDGNGELMDSRITGDPASYGPGEWEACMARNTGADTPLDTTGLYCFDVSVPNVQPDVPDVMSYTVRVAGSNFQPGGALYDYFGEAPTASRPSPEQTNDVQELGDNVLTYDFGYYVEPPSLGSLGDRVWLDADGNGVQDGGEAGINGVTVELYDGDGNLVASQVTAGDGEYLFTDLPEGTYTVVVDASTLPAGLAQTYDLDGLTTANAATVDLAAGEDRLDADFGYTPCQPCDGKVSLLNLTYLGDSDAWIEVFGRRGPSKNDPLFSGMVAAGGELLVVGPNSGNGGFTGTLGTEITIYVDGVENTKIHTSCSQPIGPGQIYGDFLITYAESKNGGPLCPLGDGVGSGGGGDTGGGGGGCDDGGGSTAPGTGTIGYWKNHPEAWPMNTIVLGGVTYTQDEAIDLLRQSVRGDATIALVKQLIAAKLNVEIGNESSCVDDTIAAADTYLASYTPGCKPKGSAKNTAIDLKDVLDDYNNGRLCAPHR